MSKALITMQSVYKLYKAGPNEVRALDNISLKIKKGEFTAIVGQSGSGKSTLMNILGCLDVATKGEYYLNDRSVASLNDNELSNIRNQKIGFIFQGFNLISSLNAYENVELPLIYRGIRREERKALALAALSHVGLENRIRHRPSEMSGGQQQRVAIARAIAARPPIILADEPTGNLDSRSGSEVMKILTDLNMEGKTIILITHDTGIAHMAQRIVHIHDGQIIKDQAVS